MKSLVFLVVGLAIGYLLGRPFPVSLFRTPIRTIIAERLDELGAEGEWQLLSEQPATNVIGSGRFKRTYWYQDGASESEEFQQDAYGQIVRENSGL